MDVEEPIDPDTKRGEMMTKRKRLGQGQDGQEPASPEEVVPIKIRRGAYRLVKTAAAWMDISAVDYLTRIIIDAVPRDLPIVSEELRPVIEQLREVVERALKKGGRD